jgi:predicted carbohydrate-binding protein with CBM5 and CBM33 domain
MTEVTVLELWAGVDAGNAHHHCTVINAEGTSAIPPRAQASG